MAFMERQLDRIRSDVEAVVWAVGCVWALRVERVILRLHPGFNVVLFLGGLTLGVNMLLPHLSWYGVPAATLDAAAATPRAMARAMIFIACVALVGVATPGSPRRRIFAACTFPLFGIGALVTACLGIHVASVIVFSQEQLPLELLLRGLACGVFIAAVLSLPAVLLYRTAAAPVGTLALLPIVAKADWAASYLGGSWHETFLWHLGSFLCALALLSLFTHACRRWQLRSLIRAQPIPPR
jgi:hypothetical protein